MYGSFPPWGFSRFDLAHWMQVAWAIAASTGHLHLLIQKCPKFKNKIIQPCNLLKIYEGFHSFILMISSRQIRPNSSWSWSVGIDFWSQNMIIGCLPYTGCKGPRKSSRKINAKLCQVSADCTAHMELMGVACEDALRVTWVHGPRGWVFHKRLTLVMALISLRNLSYNNLWPLISYAVKKSKPQSPSHKKESFMFILYHFYLYIL